jgi:hypothetical protein
MGSARYPNQLSDLSLGVAGGQTITGGTAAGEALTLHSTAHATKGSILLGSATGFAFDEATGNVGIGVAPTNRLKVAASKSVIAAAGAVWDGVNFAASTLTLTGTTTPVTAISFTTIAAPTINCPNGAITIARAATVTIAGPPVAGTNATITASYALWAGGDITADGNGVSTGIRTQYSASGPYVSLRSTSNYSQIVASGANGYVDVNATAQLRIHAGTTDADISVQNDYDLRFQINGSNEVARLTKTTYNLLVGTTVDTLTSRFKVIADRTVASASNPVWHGVNFGTSTLTLTGSTQCTNALAFMRVAAPTITDASAVTVDTAVTLYVSGAPAAAGSVTITSPYAIWVDAGLCRFDGDGDAVFAVTATANGTQTVAYTNNVGPGASGLSVVEWLTVKVGANTRQIPLFG